MLLDPPTTCPLSQVTVTVELKMNSLLSIFPCEGVGSPHTKNEISDNVIIISDLINYTSLIKSLTLSLTSPGFMCLQYKSFENMVGKGEIARKERLLLFPHCFLHV